MPITFDIFAIVTSIGLFIIFFLIIMLLKNKRGNKKANIVFVCLLFCTSFVIADSGIILYTGIYRFIPHFAKIPTVSQLLYGPLFLIYLQTLLRNKKIFSKYSLLHFLPFVAVSIIFMPFFVQGGEFKNYYVYNRLNDLMSRSDIVKESLVNILILIHICSYFIYSLMYVHKFEKALKISYSYEKKYFLWIKQFAALFLFIGLIMFMLYCSVIVFNFHFRIIYRFVPILSTASLCYLIYRAAVQSDILFGIKLPDTNKRFYGISLSQFELKSIVKKIVFTMKHEKAFRKMTLSMDDLAKRVGTSRNIISFILNNHFNESFYNFVNRYRIEEAKKVLMQEDFNIKFPNVGLDVGFNSKTAFNVNFKKATKMSPSEFRKHYIGLKPQQSSIDHGAIPGLLLSSKREK